MTSKPSAPVRRSLVIAPQWIGDAVMTEPLLRLLHTQGAHITVAALGPIVAVYRAMPAVQAVIDLPFAHGRLDLRARRRLAQTIKGQFDVAYVLPNSAKSALLPLLAGIPERVGYLGEARVGLLTHRLKNPPKDRRPPMVALYLALGGQAWAAGAALPRPQLQISEAAQRAALAAYDVPRQGFRVFAPGAEYGPAKRWPAAHYAALAAASALPVRLLGSGKESALCDDIVAQALAAGAAPGQVQSLAGATPLADAMALIAACASLVSNDSGLMHVGAALGVPQVALFGSSSPEHTPPLNHRAKVLWLKTDAAYTPALGCAPCFARECPLGHTRCLQDILPASVAKHW
jgi:heptosyltransferase II